MNALLEFALYALAVYRLGLMLSSDTGPWHVFERFRSWLKKEARQHPAVRKSDVAKGAECIRCSTVWVALVVAVWALYRGQWFDKWFIKAVECFLLAMSLSAIAILFNRMFNKK